MNNIDDTKSVISVFNMKPEQMVRLRSNIGITQHKLAMMLGYKSRSMICQFETGAKKISPRVALLCRHIKEKYDAKK